MVQEEHGIAGTGKQIAARVAANGEVACCVHAQEPVCEITLHRGGEVVEGVGVVDEGGDVGV
jgi:hypothetical protein